MINHNTHRNSQIVNPTTPSKTHSDICITLFSGSISSTQTIHFEIAILIALHDPSWSYSVVESSTMAGITLY